METILSIATCEYSIAILGMVTIFCGILINDNKLIEFDFLSWYYWKNLYAPKVMNVIKP